MPSGSRRAAGFAYLLLLISIAVLGLASAGAVMLAAVAERRSAERQLFAIGLEFRRALQSFAAVPLNTPAEHVQGPRELEELLKDPRVPGIRRHLRRIYEDPLTGKSEWGTLRNARGQIVAVYSHAPGKPIKSTGFEQELAAFENSTAYQQWVFGFAPNPASKRRE